MVFNFGLPVHFKVEEDVEGGNARLNRNGLKFENKERMRIVKKKVALFLVLILLMTSIAGCNVKTKDEVKAPEQNKTESKDTSKEEKKEEVKKDPIDLTVLAFSFYEKDVNILRDQLNKAGFNVKVSIQPDYSSYSTQEKAGNYDIAVSGWTTVTANPDYAIRPLFYSGADFNTQGIENKELDQLIEAAAAGTEDQYKEGYGKVEKIIVEDNAYILPFYSGLRIAGINKEMLKENSYKLMPSGSPLWQQIDFNDEAQRSQKPLLLTQMLGNLTSLDPVKANDGSINEINSNMYTRLVILNEADKVVTDGALSYNYAIANENQNFYFILRDDVNFAKVENKKAVDSGERVGAEDVVFSMNRAKDKDAVPDHRTYSLHGSMDKIEVVSDLAELEQAKDGLSGKSVKEKLSEGLPTAISQLVADKKDANNKAGAYQVVKITTKTPFPQVLNFLAHQSAGILCKNQVEKINTFDVASYDRNKDIAYGDQSTVTEGDTYNNTLFTSGPYILVYKNDYEAVFEKNPGYRKGTNQEPRIEKIVLKFIKDQDSALSALRSGDIYATRVPEDKVSLVENDAKLALLKVKSNTIMFGKFNLRDTSVCSDANLRKAILYTVNQDEFIAVYNNLKGRIYSTVSTIVDTGNEIHADPEKAKAYLDEYYKNKK